MEVVRKAVAHVQLVLGSCQSCHECQGCACREMGKQLLPPSSKHIFSKKLVLHWSHSFGDSNIIHIYIDGSLMSLTSGCRDIQSVIWGPKEWLGELLNSVLPRSGTVLMTTRAQRNASNVVNLAAGESPICGNWTLKSQSPGFLKRKEHHHLYIYICLYKIAQNDCSLCLGGIPSCQKCHGPKITLDHPLI